MMKNIIRTLQGEITEEIPIWYMRQAGRYLPEYLKLREAEENFISFCLNSEFCVEATLQPLRRFNLSAAILFADILLIPHFLGQKVHFEKHIGPVLAPFSFDRLDRDGLLQLSPIYKTIRLLKSQLAPDKALIGFSGAPWTLACYMLAGRSEPQQETAKLFLFSKPQLFSKLISLLTDCVSDYLIAQIDAGAEIVQIFDSWAGVLPAHQFENYVIAPTEEIVRNIRAVYKDVPIIGFARGAGVLSETYAKTGINAISVDSTLPLSWISKKLQSQIVVQGNLDPVLAIIGGAPMLQAAEKILTHLGEGAFIFNLGHGILPSTPPDNILALTQFVERWKR